MSAAERIAAVKAFLKKLKSSTPRPDKPFFNTNAKTSAAARTLGPLANGEETIREHQEFTKHSLHDVCKKFGYEHCHSHPVVQADRSTRDYHIWTNKKSANQIGSYSGSHKWTSRTVASGHSFSGDGAAELESHLKNKQRRQKYAEERSIPNLPILENLMNTSRISSYTNYMKKHPTLSGFGADDKSNSPKQALKEAWKLRDESNSKFDYGKKPGDSTWLDWKSHSSYWEKKEKK
jgi:hypothetical protein